MVFHSGLDPSNANMLTVHNPLSNEALTQAFEDVKQFVTYNLLNGTEAEIFLYPRFAQCDAHWENDVMVSFATNVGRAARFIDRDASF